MTYDDIVKTIKNRIQFNQDKIKFIDDRYIKAFSPEGYKSSTSYNDYDSIHGSRKEISIDKYLEEKEKILFKIELDQNLLDRFNNGKAIKNYLELIPEKFECVGFLRIVFELRLYEIAELMNYSERYVQKLWKKYRESHLTS